MSKRELIESIMKLNHSARREFLLQFSESELDDYLRQLETIEAPIASYGVVSSGA